MPPSTRRILIFSVDNADVNGKFAKENIFVISYFVVFSTKFLESDQKSICLAYAGKFT
jgi:hypothetical protein